MEVETTTEKGTKAEPIRGERTRPAPRPPSFPIHRRGRRRCLLPITSSHLSRRVLDGSPPTHQRRSRIRFRADARNGTPVSTSHILGIHTSRHATASHFSRLALEPRDDTHLSHMEQDGWANSCKFTRVVARQQPTQLAVRNLLPGNFLSQRP